MEFLMVGLVPGQVNEVTLQVLDSSGNVTDSFTFQITAPDTVSGYATLLESTDGTSQEALKDGGDMICCVSSDQIGRINALGWKPILPGKVRGFYGSVRTAYRYGHDFG